MLDSPAVLGQGSSGARKGMVRSVGSSCADVQVPRGCGEEQSVVCELSVGQVCGLRE